MNENRLVNGRLSLGVDCFFFFLKKKRLIIPELKMAQARGVRGANSRPTATFYFGVSLTPPPLPFNALETGQHVPKIFTKISNDEIVQSVKKH